MSPASPLHQRTASGDAADRRLPRSRRRRRRPSCPRRWPCLLRAAPPTAADPASSAAAAGLARGFRLPEFIKFTGEDGRTTLEHIAQFIVQCGEVSGAVQGTYWIRRWALLQRTEEGRDAIKPEESSKHLKPLYLKGHINGRPISRMMVDGGAAVKFMPYSLFKKLGREDSLDLTECDFLSVTKDGFVPGIVKPAAAARLTDYKVKVIELLKQYVDCFAWDLRPCNGLGLPGAEGRSGRSPPAAARWGDVLPPPRGEPLRPGAGARRSTPEPLCVGPPRRLSPATAGGGRRVPTRAPGAARVGQPLPASSFNPVATVRSRPPALLSTVRGMGCPTGWLAGGTGP
ncbi:hypothetical protein U9M48_012501 [Paspalum notatum var. saurae]|uniref:Uncharacterized protein n=1 Tax=Paspalum notatum var. saurae TaxID=547442 RepID=A0AAQ3T071_PASNO